MNKLHYLSILIFLLSCQSQQNIHQKAVAVLQPGNESNVKGTVFFEQDKSNVIVTVSVSGLNSNSYHGFHVHEFGDLSNGCESTCSHYNPYNLEHGGARGKNRHQGDFGNVEANEDGICFTSKIVDVNLDEVIGRALILHENEDDLGKESNKQSKITGNAGKKIACGVIGIAHK